MTKKTRIRIARIAAGAVIAAGASLTVAGAASALDSDVEVGISADDPTTPPAPDPTEPTEEPTEIPTEPTEEPTEPTEEPTEPTEEPTEPTEEPTEPTEEPSSPGNGNGGGSGGDEGNGNGGGTGGNSGNDTNPDGAGSQPVEQGAGKESLTDTGSDVSEQGTSGQGTSAQGTGDELAETGAAENITFLMIGAATMIAGGIGFRMLPRVMNGRGTAA